MKHLIHICKALFLGLLLASCGRADRMRSLLEQAEWMNRNDSLFTSDSIGRALVRYYDHWWHPADLRLRAYYMLGCAYRDMGNAPRALENYQLAAAQVDTLTAPDSTLNRLMRVHSQMSQIYLLQRLPEQEKQELQTAERLAWRTGDTLSALIFEEGLCNILYQNGQYKECINAALILQKRYLSHHFEEEAKLANVHFIRAFIALGDYPKAKKHLDLYESSMYIHSMPQKVYGGPYGLYIYKGQYFQGVDNVDSAEYYFRKAMLSPSNGIRLLAYKGLCQSSTILQIQDSISKFFKLYSRAKERSFENSKAEAMLLTKSLYDYSIEKQTAEKKRKQNNRLTLYLIISFFIILLIILFFSYMNERRKREISELRREYDKATHELKDTEEILTSLRLEKAEDDDTISQILRDRDSLKTRVSYLEKTLLRMAGRKSDVDLSHTDIVKKFRIAREHGTLGSYALTQEDWETLRKTVERIHPTFYANMHTRQVLTLKDYQICLLVKSQFGPTDINVIMGQEHSYSTKAMERLHKKVFGIEGSAAQFRERIVRI